MTFLTTFRGARGLRPAVVLALTLVAGALTLPVAGLAAQALPTASTSNASSVGYSSATLNGYIDAKGAGTNYLFQYGTTSGYGAQSPLSPGGNATTSVRVSQAITGLQPTTVYHYRVVAFGPSGTADGKDRTFTTGKVPLSVQLVGAPNPVVFGSPFFVEGTLSGTGAVNHEIVLQANPFPYLGGFKTVGNPEVTNSTGGFSFAYPGLLENAQLRVVTVGSPVVTSSPLLEEVAVRASVHVRSTNRRGFVRLYGTVAPAEVGALVGFQFLKPGHASVNQGGTVVKAGSATVSRYSGVMRLSRPGLYRVLIKVSLDGAHVSNYSAPILIR
ncbi:MAG TPA: hypothetical protein VFC30_02130 [Solirubrobacteraceae bacterium]|nr:hypothetical protein [Solirubrobacteraceae bacterium]